MIRLALLAAALAAPAPYPAVAPGPAFRFPRDDGAHPAFRTEWWYLTGALHAADGHPLGFQVTFFRTRPAVATGRSRFAPGQVLFAHAALSDPALGHLLHAERSGRAGFGLAGAAEGDTDVGVGGWQLRRLAGGDLTARVDDPAFGLALRFRAVEPVLLQGQGGYSSKGPLPRQASYYYSRPHLAVTGRVRRGGRTVAVTGEAWLDREWSSDYLAPAATGWDWTGLNLAGGAALTAFRIRRADGGTLWAGGSFRAPDGRTVPVGPDAVRFVPLAWWRSPRTGARYPVAQRVEVRLADGLHRWDLRPLFPDQELDGRRGGLPVYWEGAVRTAGGQGYLELTGYVAPLTM